MTLRDFCKKPLIKSNCLGGSNEMVLKEVFLARFRPDNDVVNAGRFSRSNGVRFRGMELLG